MILFGCLLAMTAAVAPRLVLILAWVFGDRWDAVWQGEYIWPLLGIIFLPYTTIMYLLVWSPALLGGSSIEGWDWMWIIMGIFLDLWKWSQVIANRKEATTQTQKYYPGGAPGGGGSAATTAAISTGQVPPITSPTSVDAGTAPTATTAPPEPPPDDAGDTSGGPPTSV